MSGIRERATSGIIWSGIERFAVQGMQFVIQLVMARILMPGDYALVAMLAIFLAVAQTFIDSGFHSALVQKKDRTETDYSTVFYFNIAVGVLCSLLLYFLAGAIGGFYNSPALVPLTKVMALNLVLLSLSVVQRAKLTIQLDFKTQAKASLIAVIISGAVGIWAAWIGFGVWAIVLQTLLNSGINTILLWIFARWIPTPVFSWSSFRQLFSFGSKLLFSGLLNTTFQNIYQLVIGKKFPAAELGYYSRADQFAQFPANNLASIIGRVIFPVMCDLQHDANRLRVVFKKYIRNAGFIISPIMFGIAALAHPLIRLLLTEKWEPAAIMLQLLCMSYVFLPLHSANLSILQAMGRSDLFLRLEIIKKLMMVVAIILTLHMGVLAMCVGIVATSLVGIVVNALYTRRQVDVTLWEQCRAFAPSFLLSAFMGSIVYGLTLFGLSDAVTVVLGIGVGIIFYLTIAFVGRFESINDLTSILNIKLWRTTK